MSSASPDEMMIAAAAAELAGVRTVFVGIGLPNAAANLARHSVAPDLELIYESGVVGARPARLPDSIGDPALVSGSAATMSMRDLFGGFLQGGRIEVGMLGAAQIDRWGNLNTTVIGPYEQPSVRLPGSVERVDFVTSPGHHRPDGRGQRPAWAGAGPTAVITQLGLYHFGADGEMELAGLHPGVDEATVDAGTGWPMRRVSEIRRLPEPSAQALATIRRLLV